MKTWPIDGEELSITDISNRFPHFKLSTLYTRLKYGDRTLALLGRPLGAVTARQIANKARSKKIYGYVA